MLDKVTEDLRSFHGLLEHEWKHVLQRRRRRGASTVDTENRPSDLRGIALSGGGIRSASVSLGALQALESSSCLRNFDYLSTVSGGGYTGACLSVSMSEQGGGRFPFGEHICDSPVVGHIRNFSSYLLPRNRSALRNWGEAAVVVLRGLVANVICVLAFLLPFVLLTAIAFPNNASLADANFAPRVIWALGEIAGGSFEIGNPRSPAIISSVQLATSLMAGGALLVFLAAWAALKSIRYFDPVTDDGAGAILKVCWYLLAATGFAIFLDLQPVLIDAVSQTPHPLRSLDPSAVPALIAILTGISAAAGRLGRFLEASKRSSHWRVIVQRFAARAALIIGALIVPFLLWLTYAMLYRWVTSTPTHFPALHMPSSIGALLNGIYSHLVGFHWSSQTPFDWVTELYVLSVAVIWCFLPNNYSLHWLYRDRLSRAFLVSEASPQQRHERSSNTRPLVDPKVESHAAMKLSQLADSDGPYPILNAAINLQGSLEANRRGRNADFFMFSPDFVGSELTGFAPVKAMERVEPRLDLASAIAVSGAAASANMGGSTVRLLSPTLALLNVRLGYYLRNPRYLGVKLEWQWLWRWFSDRFFLFREMFNLLHERSRTVYLSDGGHIENLGIYQLLRRQCSVILAIDAEADPEFGCGSLLRLERYARIDLGVRISVPWEDIARGSAGTSDAIAAGSVKCDEGPHCAVGRIFYADDSEGLLIYIKSSLTGDERDYIIDYARRNSAFPHEGTSDQFFSEEQFEMYRALGFHMMAGVFQSDHIAFVEGDEWGFADETSAREAVLGGLGYSLDRGGSAK